MRVRPSAPVWPLAWLPALLLAGPAFAQADAAAPTAPVAAAVEATEDGVTRLLAPAEPADGAWVEVTPLGDRTATARRWSMVAGAAAEPSTAAAPEPGAAGDAAPAAEAGDLGASASPATWPELRAGERLDPELPRGPAAVCTGAPGLAVGCRRVFLHRPGPAISRGPAVDALTVELDLGPGFAVVGAYRMDGLPVEGARVSVAPATLESARAFTLPLEVDGPRLRRSVDTDADGRFALPPLRPGTYRLETRLPTGAIHRPEPFELPAVDDVLDAAGPRGEDDQVVWDVGEFEAIDGLAVEVFALDGDGRPVEGAAVEARQGATRRDLRSFRGRVDADGWRRLSGFTVDLPLRLDCSAPGYSPWGADYELLPVEVVCTLERRATITGRLVDVNGEAAGGAVSARRRVDGEPAPGAPGAVARPDVDGHFRLEVAPGTHQLTAAAPGLRIDRRVVQLAAGEVLDLGELPLGAGRPIEGRVVEAPAERDGPPPLVQRETEPIAVAGAEIRALEPPGAALASTDADGRFELAAIGDSPLHLEVAAEGFAAHRLELDRAAQRRDAPLEIALERGGWIRAVVDDDDGPCAGCALRLEPGGVALTTDADGEALTPALRSGRYRIERPRVVHLGSQVVEIPATISRRARVVAGEITTVRFELEPERWPVRFVPAAGPDWWLIARTSAGEERLEPAADGLFHVPRPRGEPRHLFLTRFDPRAGAAVEVRVATLDGSRRPRTTQAGPEPLDVPLPDGHVEGRVSDLRPPGSAVRAPRAGVRVRLQTVESGAHVAELRTGPDGHFELPHVPPGVYSVVLGERAFQFISIAPGQELDLGDFQLFDGGF
ncbi:MAG: carboxypeptidase-like regulatory domain-containing protein [Acidobacteriota bacterium]